MRGPLLLGLLAATTPLAGCAGERANAPAAARAGGDDGREGASRLDADEVALLRALSAADARLAVRFGAAARAPIHASGATLGAAAASDDFDVFAFDRREVIVGEAARSAASWRYPLAGEADRERALVRRMIAEERARIDEERRLPRSASELVRALVATWTPATADEAKRRDPWLAEHLDEVRRSLAPSAMSLGEVNELDDALDGLERITSGCAATAKSLALLRVALGDASGAATVTKTSAEGATTTNSGAATKSAATATNGDRWSEIREGLRVHAGVGEDGPELRALFTATEKRLRGAIAARSKRMAGDRAREAEEASAQLVLIPGRCDGRGSRIRAAAPPPERAAMCGAARAIAESRGDEGDLAALLALHDDVVVGLWALAIREGRLPEERATMTVRPLGYLPPEREGPLARLAAVRAVTMIATARAVAALDANGEDHLRDRAARWLTFGDAPFDVVLPMLGE